MCWLHYPLFLFSFIPTLFLPFQFGFVSFWCMSPPPEFIPQRRGHELLGLPYFLLSLPRLVSPLGMASCRAGSLGFYLFPQTLLVHLPCFYFLLHLWACWPVGLLPISSSPHDPFALFLPLTTPVGLLAHWALTSFFGPSWPICFVLPLSLSSHGPFFMLFPLVVLMGLLAAISCHASPLGFLSFFLSSLGLCGPFASILFFPFFSFLIFACYQAFLLLGPLYKKMGINIPLLLTNSN